MPGNRRLREDGRLFWGAATVLVGLLIGAATYQSIQIGLTIVLVAVVATAHLHSRWTGLVALWSLWFLAPFMRRLLDLIEISDGPDPLALAPFVATVLVAAIDYGRHPVAGRAWVVPAVAAGGFALGIPAGLADPKPLAFALFAYLAGVSAYFIGYSEPLEANRPMQLERILLLLIPAVAIYAIYQSLFPLPAWDERWLETVDITPFGSKEDGNFRTFGTLNAPGTLGAVLALVCAFCLAARRQTAYVAIVGVVALAAMALTYVRSAWLALTFAMLLTMVLGGGRYLARVLVVASVVLALVLGLGPRSTIGAQVVERATTLGSLGQDVSAQERLDTTAKVLPVAVRAPVGEGLGAVGQARTISDEPERFEFPDNGYLAILYQSGPVGFLMVVGSLVWVVLWSLRSTLGPRWRGVRLSALVGLGTFMFLQVGADVLYGATGPMVWYLAGVLMRLGEKARTFGGG